MGQLVVVDVEELKKLFQEISTGSMLLEKEEISNKALFTKDVAKYLRTSPSEVDRMAEKGELPGKKIRGRWRFSSQALEKWLSGQGTE